MKLAILSAGALYFYKRLLLLSILLTFAFQDDLDALEKLVRDKFSAVPNTNAVFDKFSGLPFEPSQLKVRLFYFTLLSLFN